MGRTTECAGSSVGIALGGLLAPAPAVSASIEAPKANVFKYFNTSPKSTQTWSQFLAVGAYTFITRIISWLDNVFLTPFRIYLFIAAAVAGSATGIIALSPLMGILGLVLPLVILAVIGLAYTFYGRHKGTTLKERDLINILKERYSATFVGINLATSLGQIQLLAAQVISVEGIPYFSAIYYEGERKTEIPDERYVTKIQLTEEEKNEYRAIEIRLANAADEESLGTAKLDLLNKQKEFLGKTVKEKENPSSSLVGVTKSSWFFRYYIKPWLDFDWRNKTFKARFEFLKEHLMEPLFNVAFNAAMGYWTIWSIAAFTGHLATTSSLPFASPFILIVPLVVGIIYIAAQIISSYRTSRIKNSSDATKLVSMVAKMTSAQREAGNALDSVKDHLARAKIKAAAAARIKDAVEKSAALPKYSPSVGSRMYNFFLGGKESQSLLRVANSTLAGVRFRVGLNLLARFATGLILTFIALWPLVDLLTQAAAITTPPVYLAWLSVAAFMGLCYLVYGTIQRSKNETKRYKDVTNYKEREEFKRLVALQASLDSIRAANKTQRQSNYNLRYPTVASRLSAAFDGFLNVLDAIFRPLLRRLGLNDLLAEEVNGSREASADVIGPDSPEFAEKMNIIEKTWRKYLWLLLKQAARRFNTWIGSAGSAVFLIRLVFIAGSVVCGMLALPEMPVIATGTFVAIGVFAALWSIIKLGFLLYERDERFVLLLIEENASYEVIMKQAITLGLIENYKLGGSVIARAAAETTLPSAMLPAQASSASAALTSSSSESVLSGSEGVVTVGTAIPRKPAQIRNGVGGGGGWLSFFASWLSGQQQPSASGCGAAAAAAGEGVEAAAAGPFL